MWRGRICLGSVEGFGEFEVFNSNSGWAFLFGKPLLRVFGVVHDYASDTVSLQEPGGGMMVLRNEVAEPIASIGGTLGISLTLDVKQWETSVGGSSGSNPPSRQVSDVLNAPLRDQIDQHDLQCAPTTPLVVNVVNTDRLYTRHMDLFRRDRVAKILESITIGPDTSEEQRQTIRDTVTEFTDCFALSLSEVNIVPGAEHRLNIPAEAVFSTHVGQRSMNPMQRKFQSSKAREMYEAGIVAPIHPCDMRCTAPTILTKKDHDGMGLTLDELKHAVNDQCVSYGIPSAFDLPPRPAGDDTPAGVLEEAASTKK